MVVGRYKYQRYRKRPTNPSNRELVQEGQSDLSEFKRVAPAESANRDGISRCVELAVVVSDTAW